jgi:hypothetical protein
MSLVFHVTAFRKLGISSSDEKAGEKDPILVALFVADSNPSLPSDRN